MSSSRSWCPFHEVNPSLIEKPNLKDEKIIACLQESYGVTASRIEFLPLGNDSSAWVYRVETEKGKTYFLKVRKGTVDAPSVLVPRYLREQGIEQVVAVYPTKTLAPWQEVEDYVLLLYPFIEGKMGMEIGLTDSQWIEYGDFLRKLHATKLPGGLLEQLRKETFIPNPKWSGVVRELQVKIKHSTFANPFEKALAAFWKEKSVEIGKILDRADELGKMLQEKRLDYVLCHADIHTANLLLTQEGRMYVVDWDGPILAPKERDLMFIVGASVGGFVVESKEETLFFRGYGRTEVDPLALAYYRYEWVVQDIGDYGERVFLMEDVGDETKEASVRSLMDMFQAGNVAESAYMSEVGLS